MANEPPAPDGFLPPEPVGFVGLGNMGAPMAGHLARAGYRLVVADVAPAARERFRATVACDMPASLAELARACRVVITMLPDGAAVRSAVLGEGGITAGLAAGGIVIDMSSSSPVGTRALNAELAARGITLLDAPVSGGVAKAVQGKLAIMAGGDAPAVQRCRALLETMGQVFVTGASGSGHAMKALNNFLSAAALATAAEAVLAGERFGLDPAVMIRIFNASTGRNTATETKYPNFVLPRTFNSGFSLGLMAKDLRLALDVARATGTPSGLLQACSEVYDHAEQQLGFRADNTEVVKYLESLIRERANG
jgi:3-hydroxyisobutyrate dehydrogenase